MFETSGKIKVVFDTQTFPSGFQKREFVVTTNHDKYPQDLKFEVVKDKCEVLEQFREGQDVTVSFDVRGNEYNSKYYVSLSAWKVTANGPAPSGSKPAKLPPPNPTADALDEDFDDDSIPFN